MTKRTGESLGGGGNNPETTDEWGEFGTGARGTFVMGPDGKMIPKEQLDAAEEAHRRAEWYKAHPDVQQAKEKWTSKGWAHMTHWYKEHPDEIDELISPDSKHDKRYYLKQQEEDPRTIGYLVAEYLARKARGANSGEQTPQPNANPNGGTKPEDKGAAPEAPGSTKIEIGEVKIEGIDLKIEEIKEKEIKDVEAKLEKMRPELAEYYARNRRLIIGNPKNRSEFQRLKGEYTAAMSEYIRLKCAKIYESKQRILSKELEQQIKVFEAQAKEELTIFAEKEISGSYRRTQEEIDAERERLAKKYKEKLETWLAERNATIKTEVNTEHVGEWVEQATALESATNHALDEGTRWRSFVSKVLNNKFLKGALVVAGAAGLVATGAAVIGGAVTIGFGGLTAGGVALGAVKGGASAFLMSRQDSKASKVHGFASEEEIRQQIGEMDVTGENADTQNVAKWLMGQYGEANAQDRSSNKKRTVVAVGIGAALGALASGLRFNQSAQSTQTTATKQVITGNHPIVYRSQNDISSINLSPNHGYLQAFEQMGGDPTNQTLWGKAFTITQQVASRYGAVSNYDLGLISPAGGPELLPGSPSTWDTVSRQMMQEIVNEWAKAGVIPRIATGGGPIWNTVNAAAQKMVTNSAIHRLGQFITTVAPEIAQFAPGVIIGSMIGGVGRKNNRAPQSTPTSPENSGAPSAPETPPAPSAPETPPAPSTPEASASPERPLSPEEIAEAEKYAEIFNELNEKGEFTEAEIELRIECAIAYDLGYFEQGVVPKEITAFNELSSDQQKRLRVIFNRVVETASNQRSSAPAPQQQLAN